ncbi:uncharacterized protein METZ01_LOCUS408266, partial [marine metagenome]
MPFGASVINATSITPTTSKFISDEIVTVITSCAPPTTNAPIMGPIHVAVPPIIGIAMALT